MTYQRITVVMTDSEMQALQDAAQRELRRPREQARHILRSVLFGEGLGSDPEIAPVATQTNGAREVSAVHA